MKNSLMKFSSIFFLAYLFVNIYSHSPLITEIMVDPTGADFGREWIEVYNPTSSAILIDGWQVDDGFLDEGGYWTIPSNGYYLYPNGYITFAQNGDSFFKTYGFAPDFAVNIGATTAKPLSSAGSLTLANTGDQAYLRNASDSIIDCMGYVTKGTFSDSIWYPLPLTVSTNVSYIRSPQNTEGKETSGEASESLSVVWFKSSAQTEIGPDTGGLHPQGITIKNIVQNPGSPTFLEKVIISGNAVSDTDITSVRLYWTRILDGGGTLSDSSLMNKQPDDTTFIDTIIQYPIGTLVKYYFKATDSKSRTSLEPADAPVHYYEYFVSDTGAESFEIHFNKTVDTTLAVSFRAEGEDSLDYHLGKYIHNAEKTIDCCFYDFDRQVIADSLVAAHNRGVKVRFITDTDNVALPQVVQLQSAGITVITDAFPLTYGGSNIMHNKFAVIDTQVLFTGSWNITDNCTDRNANNSIIIKNRIVSENYLKEFTEMWGSSTMTPNASVSKFSTQKTDNITHQFIVDNDTVKVYMSPSDGCASKMISAINTANSSIYFCIFSFSSQPISDAMRIKYNGGVDVRGVFDATYWNADYSKSLDMRGLSNLSGDNNPWSPPADVFKDSVDGNLLHHKYMLIDSDKWTSNPIVITGSYNWSDAAEDGNDENLVIIHSKYFAEMFLQEFSARYAEAGGVRSFTVDTKNEQINISAKRSGSKVIIDYSVFSSDLTGIELQFENDVIFYSPLLKGSFTHENSKGGAYKLIGVCSSGRRDALGSIFVNASGKTFSIVSENNLWSTGNPYKARINGNGDFKIEIINGIGEIVYEKNLKINVNGLWAPDKKISGGIYFIRYTDEFGNQITDKVLKVK